MRTNRQKAVPAAAAPFAPTGKAGTATELILHKSPLRQILAEANLSALIESTEDQICSVDLQFRVLAFNTAFKRHLENYYGTHIAVGKPLADLVPPERVVQLLPLFKRALTRGPHRAELPVAAGRTIELAFNPILVDGRPTGISIFGKDITDRQQSELTLRETANFLEETQAIAAIGSYVLDIRAGTWSASGVLQEIFGMGPEDERTIASLTQLIHPEDREAVVAHYKLDVIGKEQNFDREFRILRVCDKAERWVHGKGRLQFDEHGAPIKLTGIIRDITKHKLAELSLRDSEERYRSTFDQAAVGIIHTAFDGRFLRANARFAQIIGYPLDEVPSLTFQQITAPEDFAESIAALRPDPAAAVPETTFEKRYIRKDGSITWVRITISIQRDGERNPVHYIALVEDINALKAAQEALRNSEQLYRTVFMTSLDAVTISGVADGSIIDANNAFLDMVGWERDEIIGRTSTELNLWVDPRDRQSLIEVLRHNHSARDFEVRFRKKNGKIIWIRSSASILEINGANCLVGVMRDISEAKDTANTIRDLAYFDSLTRLPNRRLLLERIAQSLSDPDRSSRGKALLAIDLDNFKSLNDTLGHAIGDLMLQQAAQRLQSCADDADLVGRLGGDEFVLLLQDLNLDPDIAASQAKRVAENLLESINQPFFLDGHECRCSSSIGIAVFDGKAESASEILQQADLAMYQAKTTGRNSFHFFVPALQIAANTRAALEEDLRKAIQNKEFVLYLQPQVDGKRLVGAEALIRWNHPVRGMLAPGEFITIAEETGLILPLGNWVLKAACECIARWATLPGAEELSLAVNISARQFRQPSFVALVLEALQSTAANPAHLKLELTESMLVDNIEEVIDTMNQLKTYGVRFSLDDFGTGYSSLTYLKRLPLDQLKIDRSFVRDILADQSSGAIAQTIISLSNAMGLPVIAEGVETEEQREFLVELGCHCFQGYLFSRPIPVTEFEKFWLCPGLGSLSSSN